MDLIALSIPAFFILIAIELIYAAIKGIKLYRFNDTVTNIGLGIGQQVTGLLMKGVLFLGYIFLFDNYKVAQLEINTLNWILLFLAVDFLYYWFHRLSHQINALWAAHIVHHQSEEYNLSVALRQSWFQSWFSWVFYLPLAIIGFEPIMFITMSAINTIYQFWIHTRTIGKLGPLEWIINTPSHHRVHHGSNPKYIDKNHAGSLIIWDRMFGTFQEEEEEPVYGITKPLNSWNPFWANFHYWAELWDLSNRCTIPLDKIKAWIMPPGWKPYYLGGREFPSEIDHSAYQKYDQDSDKKVHWYIGLVFASSLTLSLLTLFLADQLSLAESIHLSLSILLGVTVCGTLMDNPNIAIRLEYARFLVLISGGFLFFTNVNPGWISNAIIWGAIISLVIFRLFNIISKQE
ncbi:MAG: alkylglycerol monooxygenase [Bacteroidia bacterium]|jgi:alkylglycerol monooxygenase